jgi:preprotein translocase subunit SecA
VTIATNMAGRGTDIVLGGNWKAEGREAGQSLGSQIEALKAEWVARHAQVLEAGGLHIIGTERHESRRIDNQLRGRSGRQGDPGVSRFYLSLEDDLMRIFASDRVRNMMRSLGMQRGEAIEHRWVTRSIENAQRKVESRNFDIRKNLLKYDDVANEQRKHVYEQRREVMEAEDISENIRGIRHDVVNAMIDTYIRPQSFDETWDLPGLSQALDSEYGIHADVAEWLKQDDQLDEDGIRARVLQMVEDAYSAKEAQVGAADMRNFEKGIMLQVLDTHWKEHLAAMDHLRQGIHLRGFAQKNPKQEYKREAFEMFARMLDEITRDVIGILSKVQVRAHEDIEAVEQQQRRAAAQKEQEYHYQSGSDEPPPAAALPQDERGGPQQQPHVRDGRKVGRNEPCPCGSGKKYKQCHGKLD